MNPQKMQLDCKYTYFGVKSDIFFFGVNLWNQPLVAFRGTATFGLCQIQEQKGGRFFGGGGGLIYNPFVWGGGGYVCEVCTFEQNVFFCSEHNISISS